MAPAAARPVHSAGPGRPGARGAAGAHGTATGIIIRVTLHSFCGTVKVVYCRLPWPVLGRAVLCVGIGFFSSYSQRQ